MYFNYILAVTALLNFVYCSPFKPKNPEFKKQLEEAFIKKYDYVDTEMVLRTRFRNKKAEDRAYMCWSSAPDMKQFTLVTVPVIETRYLEFVHVKHDPIFAEMLKCTDEISIFEVDDQDCYYVLKKYSKRAKVGLTSKVGPFYISRTHCYDIKEMPKDFTLPKPARWYEPGGAEDEEDSGSGSQLRRSSTSMKY